MIYTRKEECFECIQIAKGNAIMPELGSFYWLAIHIDCLWPAHVKIPILIVHCRVTEPYKINGRK